MYNPGKYELDVPIIMLAMGMSGTMDCKTKSDNSDIRMIVYNIIGGVLLAVNYYCKLNDVIGVSLALGSIIVIEFTIKFQDNYTIVDNIKLWLNFFR